MCDSNIVDEGLNIADAASLGAFGYTATRKGTEAAINQLTPDLPGLPESPKSPTSASDQNVQGARSRERDRARAASWLGSTILTGSGGLTTAATTSPKTLLGQ